MKNLGNKYYARLLGLKPTDIADIRPQERVDIDGNVHRSSIYIKRIKDKSNNFYRILHKIIANPEYTHANHHEEVILSVSYDISSRLPGLHYTTPKFLDHTSKENMLIMMYIEGASLAARIRKLDEQYDLIERKLRNNDKSDSQKRIYWDKLDVITEIKKAFIKLSLRGLAEFQFHSRENIELFEEALKRKNAQLGLGSKEELKLYDPQKHDSKDHYKRKIICNLTELLDAYVGDYDKTALVRSISNPNPLGKFPLEPLVEAITDYDDRRIIIADYHPLHIIPLHGEKLNEEIESLIDIGSDRKIDDRDLAILVARIIDEGKVGITDLGDVRIGPELFDFADLTRNHICGLRPDEIGDEFLRYFLRERQNLRKEDVGELYAKYHNKFVLIGAYRALRAAVRTPNEWEKQLYLQHLLRDLDYRADLQPLVEVSGNYINSALENIERRLDEKNGIKLKNFRPVKKNNFKSAVL